MFLILFSFHKVCICHAPQIYTDKTFLTFLRGCESVQSEQQILEFAEQDIEVLNTKRFLSEVKH